MASYKLDMFNEVLPAIDRRDKDFYSRLSDDQKKGFAPPVILRAASAVEGPKAEEYIMMVNEMANVNFHDIWKHPELQYKLMAACGAGRSQRHAWIPNAKSGKKTDKVTAFLGQFWPDANDFELSIVLNQFTAEAFEEFVLSAGCTPEEEKEVLEAYGKLTGASPSKKGKKKAGAKA